MIYSEGLSTYYPFRDDMVLIAMLEKNRISRIWLHMHSDKIEKISGNKDSDLSKMMKWFWIPIK